MRFRVLVAVAALIMAGTMTPPGTAQASVPETWNRVFQAPTEGLMTSIAAIGSSDIWAVAEHTGSNRYQPFIRHYNGSTWKAVAIRGARFETQWVAASSAKNVWVFGLTPNSQNIAVSTVYRYDGSRWHKISVPALTNLQDPVVLGPANVWAFGGSGSLSGDIFHWNGAKWRNYNLKILPQALSASAARNVWVAGLRFSSQRVTAYRWNGKRWRAVSMPHPVAAAGPGLTVSSPTNVWIGWNTTTRTRGMHWNGEQWQIITAPDNVTATYSNIVPDGRGGDWFGPFARWTGHSWIDVFNVSPAYTSGAFGPVGRIPGTSSFWLAAGVTNVGSSTEEPTIYRFELN